MFSLDLFLSVIRVASCGLPTTTRPGACQAKPRRWGTFSTCAPKIHLIDIAQRLLDTAVERLRRSGLSAQIAGVDRLSATDVKTIDGGAFDAVLLPGPLHHLRQLSDRQRAVAESAKMLKTGGLLYAAAATFTGSSSETGIWTRIKRRRWDSRI